MAMCETCGTCTSPDTPIHQYSVNHPNGTGPDHGVMLCRGCRVAYQQGGYWCRREA